MPCSIPLAIHGDDGDRIPMAKNGTAEVARSAIKIYSPLGASFRPQPAMHTHGASLASMRIFFHSYLAIGPAQLAPVPATPLGARNRKLNMRPNICPGLGYTRPVLHVRVSY